MAINHYKFMQLERRTDVARLYLRGSTQTEIAAELGINQSTVCRYLKKVQAEWLAARLNSLDERKAIELARIDQIEREAWTAWERSKTDRETTTNEDSQNPKVVTRVEGQCGDPRYLQVIQRCIDDRCKILGLHAQPNVPPSDMALESRLLNLADRLFARVIDAEFSPVVPVPVEDPQRLIEGPRDPE